MMARPIPWLMVCAFLLLSGLASAQDDHAGREARARFDMGRLLVESGELEHAHRSFLDGYRLVPRPLFLFNMAECSRTLGRIDRARREYAEYLRLEPDGSVSADARARLDELGPGDTSTPEYLRAENAVEPAPEPAPIEEPAEPPPPASHGAEGPSRAGPIALVAAGGASLVAGVVLAVMTDRKYGELETQCPAFRCPAALEGELDQLERRGIAADIMLFGGGALALGGIVWWLVQPEESSTQVELGVGRIAVRGRF